MKPTFKAKITFHFKGHEQKHVVFGSNRRQTFAAEIDGVEGLNSLVIFPREERKYLENDSDEFDCRSIVEEGPFSPIKVGAIGKLWAGGFFADLEVISTY